MAEQTQQQQPDTTAELERLRTANSELVEKSTKRKARIAELEARVSELESANTTLSAGLRQATIETPLKHMSEQISTCPELWLEQFSKHYKLEMVDGELTLQSANGEPVMDKGGKAIQFEREALLKFLIEGDDARAKAFRAITIVSRASGSAVPVTRQEPVKPRQPGHQFGLR